MAGVWIFCNGVLTLMRPQPRGEGEELELVHRETEEVISSYEALETKLLELGWERWSSSSKEDEEEEPRPSLVRQYYCRRNGPYILTLPADTEFTRLRSVHLYDIVVQSRTAFVVRQRCHGGGREPKLSPSTNPNPNPNPNNQGGSEDDALASLAG